MADGRAWTLDPTGGGLSCLFGVADPGAFQWGPLGDRVILGGLEVRGLDGAPSLPPEEDASEIASWSHPTGQALLFTPGSGGSLLKTYLDGSGLEDITPLGGARYLNVAYHPSGRAFAFVVERAGSQSVWLASNSGEDPRRLVFTEVGTTFGALAFRRDGEALLYAAQHADGHAELHSITLSDTSEAPVLWEGHEGKEILDIWAGADPGDVAFTVGTSCADASALIRTEDGEARPALRGAAPTRALGWLDDTTVLVARGGCGRPQDLLAADSTDRSATPVVFGVDAGSVRVPAPTPPPPLPQRLDSGSGFA